MTKRKYIKPVEVKQTVGEPTVACEYTSHGVGTIALSETEIEAIKCSKEQIARGEYFTQEELDKHLRRWLD